MCSVLFQGRLCGYVRDTVTQARVKQLIVYNDQISEKKKKLHKVEEDKVASHVLGSRSVHIEFTEALTRGFVTYPTQVKKRSTCASYHIAVVDICKQRLQAEVKPVKPVTTVNIQRWWRKRLPATQIMTVSDR